MVIFIVERIRKLFIDDLRFGRPASDRCSSDVFVLRDGLSECPKWVYVNQTPD